MKSNKKFMYVTKYVTPCTSCTPVDVKTSHFLLLSIQVFPKVDHSGYDAGNVLEQKKISRKKYPLTGIECLTP